MNLRTLSTFGACLVLTCTSPFASVATVAPPDPGCCLTLPPYPDNQIRVTLTGGWNFSSKFIAEVHPGGPIPSRLAPEYYPAWCIDASTGIPSATTTYDGLAYSSCDFSLNSHLPDHPNVKVGPEVWHKINYLLNIKTLSGNGWMTPCGFATMWDIQTVIFHYVGGPVPPGYEAIPQNAAVIACLIAHVEANAPGWVPDCGDVVAVVANFDPTPFELPTDDDLQLIILEVPCVCLSSICGYVYHDANDDGIFQPAESPIPGTTVTLTGVNDLGPIVPMVTLTGPDGGYCFNDLRPGTYTITETQPAGYLDGKDTQGTPGTGTAGNDVFVDITLGAGVHGKDNNFGELKPSSICGYVYHDANDDGIFQPAESPIPGTTVTLTGVNGLGPIAPMVTLSGADGGYCFTDLLPGTYTITETQPAGYLDGKDTQGTPGTGTAGNDLFFEIALAADVHGKDNNFGELKSTPGPCVPLTFKFDGYSKLDGPNGEVRTFTVNGVGVKASAFSRNKSTAAWETAYLGAYSGGLGVTDNAEGDGSGNKHTVDNVGQDNFVLFEFSEPVIVRRAYLGYVVTDSDLTAWIGTFADPFNNHLALSDALLASFSLSEANDTTSNDPRWADLNAGEIIGNALVISASVTDTTPDDYFKIRLLDICRPGGSAPCAGSICGVVRRDCDANGYLSGEAGLPGVTVKLLKAWDSSVVATTVTDEDGGYCFTDLQDGSYVVAVATPEKHKVTRDGDDCADGKTVVRIADCANKAGVDFGYTGTSPAVHLVKTGPASAKPGDTITYKFAVTNTGNTCLYGGMTVVDPMLGGQIWHKTPVAPGEGFVFEKTYLVKASDCHPLVNTATAYGDPPGNLPIVKDESTWTVTLPAPAPAPVPPPVCTSAKGDCEKVTLCWDPCFGATSYNVKWSKTKGGPYTTVRTGLTGNWFTHTGLPNGEIFYYVVTAVKNGVESANSNERCAMTTGGLPWFCKTKDVGAVAQEGGASYDDSSETFKLAGSGNDIWNSSDEFRYVYLPAYGNCSIVARVTAVDNTNPWAKAGVMIRETLNSNSEHASVFVTPGNGVAFQYRSSTGGSSGNVSTTGPTAPYWVKLVRSGNTFTAYRSTNGYSWTSMGSQYISMGSSVYLGLAVTSHNDGVLCGATFDNVSVAP